MGHLKNWLKLFETEIDWFYNAVKSAKDADGKAENVDRDQTAPSGTV